MEAFLDVALPVFGIMAAGYLIGRFNILGQASTAALNGFVFHVALPALFFIALARAPLDDIMNLPYLAAVIGGQIGVFLLAFLVAFYCFPGSLGTRGLNAIAAIFSNTGYMGIPLLITAFGPQGALPAIIATVVNGAMMMALGTAILEVDKSKEKGGSAGRIAWDAAKGVARNPLVRSAVLGIGWTLIGLPIPKPLGTFCDLIGAAAGPCALFAMGLFLVSQRITSGLGEVGWVSFLKLIAHPLLTWWLAALVLEMEPLWVASAVIMAALPTGGLVFVLASQYQIYLQRSAAIILISTILSVITVSAILAYYMPLVPRP